MAAIDDFERTKEGLNSPADNAESVTPSDISDLTAVSRGLYVGTTGNLSVVMRSGQAVVFSSVQAGSILPVRVSRVLSTGTTAGGIVSIY